MLRRVCVFAGSSVGARPGYMEAARELGRVVAVRQLGLVYGGSNVGLMAALADAALATGGEVIGIIPHALAAKEVAHTGLTELCVVDSMHERKAQMAKLADAFVALPGGLGTLDELFEMLTWAQVGLHSKPVGLLDVGGYYQPLLQHIEHAIVEGFIPRRDGDLILKRDEPGLLLDALEAYRPAPRPEKWIAPEET
jgi:uncharacterized protein (TIGR00730 family)